MLVAPTLVRPTLARWHLDTLTRQLPFGCPELFGQPERRRRCAVSLQVKACLCHHCCGCLDIGCGGTVVFRLSPGRGAGKRVE